MWESITGNMASLASLIGSLTVVGSALMWVYNRFISSPREKRREEKREKERIEKEKQEKDYHERMIAIAKEQDRPMSDALERVNHTLDNLNNLLEESQKDRKNLHSIAEVNTESIEGHGKKLADHESRIIVMETINNKVNYSEHYATGKKKGE